MAVQNRGIRCYLSISLPCDKGCRSFSLDDGPNGGEALAHRVRVARQHRLDPMSRDLGQIGVVDSRCPQMRDVAVAALMGADV